MLSVALALLPVVGFLVVLFMMDSFKLVPLRAILGALVGGGAAALVALWLWSAFGLDLLTGKAVSHYIAPVVEETLKGSIIVLLILRGRAGFLVDAAVQGFAVGAGFALAENVTYLHAFGTAPLTLWLVRGLGTAMLHGGTTTIFAILARALSDRFPRRPHLAFLPGLAAAIVIHSAFNHLLLPPIVLAAVVMFVLPLLILLVFDRSERATREWMGAGMDLDIEVLQLVASEHFAVTRLGQYLQELRARFPGVVVANMYCLLRLELELSVHARAMIMAREAGLDLAGDEDLDASLEERNYLQRSIGKVGLLALRPLQVTSDRDRWHRQLLAQSRRRT
jgi:RsiW-degrading membrane proteinase PrsW (M82 family)